VRLHGIRVRIGAWGTFALGLFALGTFACSSLSNDGTSLISDIPGFQTSSLAHTYTGVLQETGGPSKYYVNLAQEVSVTQSGPAQLTFASNAFPSFTGVIITTGATAVNLDLVGDTAATGLQVEEVAFEKDSEGNWVLVIQTATPGDGANASLVQFASYDPASAPPATAVLAVDYLDQIFALAGIATK